MTAPTHPYRGAAMPMPANPNRRLHSTPTMNRPTRNKDLDFAEIEVGGRRVLGELQAHIMAAIWDKWEHDAEGSTIRDVVQALTEQGEANRAYTTIATIVGRLTEYGFLRQEQAPSTRGMVYRYVPQITRQDYGQTVVKAMIEQLKITHPEEVIRYFLELPTGAEEAPPIPLTTETETTETNEGEGG